MEKHRKDVNVSAHLSGGRAVRSYTQKRQVSAGQRETNTNKKPLGAQEIADDTVGSRPSLLTLGGRPVPHVIRSDRPEELVDYALGAVTCDSRHRSTIKKMMVEACAQKYGADAFRAVTRKTHLDGVSVVWTEVAPNADPAIVEVLNDRLAEEANAKISAALDGDENN